MEGTYILRIDIWNSYALLEKKTELVRIEQKVFEN